MEVPLCHAKVPDALPTVASEELFPNEYSTKDWLSVPAPLLVAAKDMAIARSTSDRVIAAGRKTRCKKSELPNPAVPVTVPEALATDPPISCRRMFWVRLIFEARLSEIVTVRDPTPVAVARPILFPAAKARLIPVPVTLFAPADRLCVPAAPPPAGTEMEMVPFPAPMLAIPIPEKARTLLNVPELVAPVVFPLAERETVEKFVTVGVVAEMVMLPAPAPTEIIPAPLMFKRLLKVPDELPVVFPRAVKETVLKLVTLGVVTEIEIEPFPAPTLAIPIPEMASTLLNVPELVAPVVFPLADNETVEKLTGTAQEIVTLPAPAPTLTPPAPEMFSRLLKVPDELPVVFPKAVRETVEKFVTVGVVAEIVMLPLPTPALIIPAPEMFKRLVNVPAEELVVFPRAVNEAETVWTDADRVSVLLACPIPIPAPAEIDKLLVLPFKLKFIGLLTFIAISFEHTRRYRSPELLQICLRQIQLLPLLQNKGRLQNLEINFRRGKTSWLL